MSFSSCTFESLALDASSSAILLQARPPQRLNLGHARWAAVRGGGGGAGDDAGELEPVLEARAALGVAI
eukprot:CAMPEP_0182525640 /NCGR_PEP_ID=MMETSP1323-20130603/2626_1 /TAXON_ID=236787 /ORGANISM="Florenciella parvula, Strain RCC1693" /LENGTH=68 /DNA_ID=CAMNT_0024734377 /DNA_START=268 /DNA_END=472 /DNA_ORIENTATION=+